MDALLPAVPSLFFGPGADVMPAIGSRRARVALLSGCVMSTLFGDVNDATIRVLRRNGCEVLVPRGQGCCGALNVHNGETVAARRMARRNVDVFLDAGVVAVIGNAAGCGAAMKAYGQPLRDDSYHAERGEEFAAQAEAAWELLARVGARPPAGR